MLDSTDVSYFLLYFCDIVKPLPNILEIAIITYGKTLTNCHDACVGLAELAILLSLRRGTSHFYPDMYIKYQREGKT